MRAVPEIEHSEVHDIEKDRGDLKGDDEGDVLSAQEGRQDRHVHTTDWG